MITEELVPEAAFLRMTWEYEPDYFDGRIVERAWPDLPHSSVQGEILRLLHRRFEEVRPYPSLRLHVQSGCYRTADVAVYAGERPNADYPSNPPLAVFDVLVPEDPFGKAVARLADFESMGTRHVWLLYPATKTIWKYTSGSLQIAAACELPEIRASFTAEEIFAEC